VDYDFGTDQRSERRFFSLKVMSMNLKKIDANNTDV